MESDLLLLLRFVEDYPGLAKDRIVEEVRRTTAKRLWLRLTEAQRAYTFGLLNGSLPQNLEWSALPPEARTLVAAGILRWAPLPSSPAPTAPRVQAEPGPTTPVGC